MPPQVIEKGLCGPGLLTHVVLAKHLEHRPLYRVQQELARSVRNSTSKSGLEPEQSSAKLPGIKGFEVSPDFGDLPQIF